MTGRLSVSQNKENIPEVVLKHMFICFPQLWTQRRLTLSISILEILVCLDPQEVLCASLPCRKVNSPTLSPAPTSAIHCYCVSGLLTFLNLTFVGILSFLVRSLSIKKWIKTHSKFLETLSEENEIDVKKKKVFCETLWNSERYKHSIVTYQARLPNPDVV